MKKLHDLKKSLPSNARLSNFEKTRMKGGSSAHDPGGDKRDRPSFNSDSFNAEIEIEAPSVIVTTITTDGNGSGS